MRNKLFGLRASKAILPALLLPLFVAFTAKPGGDHYEIYLNKKLILRQHVSQPLSLKTLSLSGAKAKDQLVIHYSHCGTIGKSRIISILDRKGNLLKKWSFADASGSGTGMVIPVKELLALEKNKKVNELVLVYTAKEIPGGKQLTAFRLGDRTTAYLLPLSNRLLVK